jgi:hypothetical protein
MSEHRDERLARALADLETPPPGPGFWERVDASIDAEEPARAPRRRRAPRRPAGRLAGAAAAFAVLILAAVLVLPRTGGGPSVATAQEVQATVADALAGAESLSATVVSRTRPPLGGALAEERFTLAMTAAGDLRLTALDGSSDVAYDAATGVERSVNPSASLGEGRFLSERTGLAPGPPDPGPSDRGVDRQLGAAVRALLSAPEADVAEVEFGGRPAWRVTLPTTPNLIWPDVDRFDVTVDRETGFPVRVVATLDGELRSELRLEGLAVNAPVATGATFAMTLPAGAEVLRSDAGFRRVPLERVAAAVGYAPLVPRAMPEGYRLAEVAVAARGGPTGVEGGNPAAADVVSLAYRRGFDRVLVTTRRAGPDPSLWSDPLASGEGLPDRPRPVTIAGGALEGTRAQLVTGPRATPHLWAIGAGLVVTVSGDLGAEGLLAVAGSLEDGD